MEYLKQFIVILCFSLAGEGLHAVIPLPIPASIYGIILLFAALMTGVVKLRQVEKTAGFLIESRPGMVRRRLVCSNHGALSEPRFCRSW